MTQLGARARIVSKCRLLVVDDHALSRKAILAVLRVRGYECAGVGTAGDAVCGIESFAPHVVILEWAFRDPRQCGLGLAEKLRHRSLELARPLSIVVVSHAEQPMAFRVREGVDAYFTKPVAPHVLVAVVDELAAQCSRETA